MKNKKFKPSLEAIERISRKYPEESGAEKYRLAQAEMLIQMFEADTGKRPSTIEELNEHFKKKMSKTQKKGSHINEK